MDRHPEYTLPRAWLPARAPGLGAWARRVRAIMELPSLRARAARRAPTGNRTIGLRRPLGANHLQRLSRIDRCLATANGPRVSSCPAFTRRGRVLMRCASLVEGGVTRDCASRCSRLRASACIVLAGFALTGVDGPSWGAGWPRCSPWPTRCRARQAGHSTIRQSHPPQAETATLAPKVFQSSLPPHSAFPGAARHQSSAHPTLVSADPQPPGIPVRLSTP